jgi:hypothetical protein
MFEEHDRPSIGCPGDEGWTVDVATGEQTEVDMPVGDWQRLAP